jgi:hypothetical protein
MRLSDAGRFMAMTMTGSNDYHRRAGPPDGDAAIVL